MVPEVISFPLLAVEFYACLPPGGCSSPVPSSSPAPQLPPPAFLSSTWLRPLGSPELPALAHVARPFCSTLCKPRVRVFFAPARSAHPWRLPSSSLARWSPLPAPVRLQAPAAPLSLLLWWRRSDLRCSPMAPSRGCSHARPCSSSRPGLHQQVTRVA
uniref:Uncharacterized protein n=1 Tax=Zea mays TaxID=4577 RepID=A0A804R8C2_MAIZE